MKISLLTPTRGRAEQLPRFWYSALENAADPSNLEVSFYVDGDDEKSIHVISGMDGNIIWTMGPRTVPLSESWNEAWRNSTGEIFMMAADDLIFRKLMINNQIF